MGLRSTKKQRVLHAKNNNKSNCLILFSSALLDTTFGGTKESNITN